MTRWTGLASLLLATLARASPELGKLHYITEENSPYNYRDGSGMTTGFAVELLQRVWQQTATSNRFNHAIKMLTSGRADLLSTNKNTFYQRIGELGLAPDQFRVQWTLSADPFCYAFSLAVSDQLVAEFQQGLKQVLTSPTYPALRRRYLPE